MSAKPEDTTSERELMASCTCHEGYGPDETHPLHCDLSPYRRMRESVRVAEERTVVDNKSLRYRCTCGAYGTPFLPGEYDEALREGRAHMRELHPNNPPAKISVTKPRSS